MSSPGLTRKGQTHTRETIFENLALVRPAERSRAIQNLLSISGPWASDCLLSALGDWLAPAAVTFAAEAGASGQCQLCPRTAAAQADTSPPAAAVAPASSRKGAIPFVWRTSLVRV